MATPLRALVVDDHPLMRTAVRIMAEQVDGLDVVGEAESGEQALGLARQLRPDLVFMDLQMPEMDGFAAIKAMRTMMPRILILVLTVADDEHDVVDAMRAGASGYLVKRAGLDEIREAIGALRRDGTYLTPSLGARALRYVLTEQSDDGPSIKTADPMTDREREVLDLLAKGLSSRQIGHQLAISSRTVQAHVTHVYRKLGVNNRVDAVMKGLELGLLAVPGNGTKKPQGDGARLAG